LIYRDRQGQPDYTNWISFRIKQSD